MLNTETGLLSTARQCPSPNADSRPSGCSPDAVVVHGISLPPGEFGGPWIDQLFSNQLSDCAHAYFRSIADLKVSAHVVIRRDGELVQYVPLHQRAWHAGLSSLYKRERCNDFSIGVELEGCDETPYSNAQYRQLAVLCRVFQHRWPAITRDRIVGHSDVSPGRKTDPGDSFDWSRLMREMDTTNTS